MSIPKKDFRELHAVAQSDLHQRVEKVLRDSVDALTAGEVVARLLGVSNRYLRILAPEVAQATPLVVQILDSFVAQGKVDRVSVFEQMNGAVAYYATSESGQIETRGDWNN